MQNQQKVRDVFLEEIHTLQKKIEEVEKLVGKNSNGIRNGVRFEDFARRLRKVLSNGDKKIEAFQKIMASKK